ncbi:Ltp family lipoprotein [uncultured Microbacterium sp.]|uniref:Ltp family lipoprotein n=1 Tax=uncultured Microbacterium sp. TaxID=191216 RepID=UPI0025FEEE5F|nr:Ltp family lipoprotein [uncultured Microbacterium sp.]
MTIPAPAPVDTPAAAKQKNPVGLAALIVGGVAFIFAVIPVLSFIAWAPAIAAIVLGIIGLVKKNRTRGLAWAGLALGVVAWIVAIAVSIATFAGAASSISESIEPAAPVAPVATPATEVTEAPVATEAPAAEATPAAPAAPELTMGQRNAVAKGENYLSFTAFSRSGLIEQLQFEGFDAADAEFAVDKIAPDWNVQAEKKAKTYLDMSSFSRDGLIEQLVFEGFTQEQAEHGATANGY